MRDEERESRDRTTRARIAIESATIEAPHTPRRYVGRVISVPAGSTPPVYLDTHPVTIAGDEVAGGGATLTPDATRTVPVLVLGSLPSPGQDVVAKNVLGRWVAQMPGVGVVTGGITGIIPDCFCSPTPGIMYMSSADTECNFRMFQYGTISYRDIPPDVIDVFPPLNVVAMGGKGYFGDQFFIDPVSGDGFIYFLTCHDNLWSLTRIFPTSPFGSPWKDAVLYTWVMGADGNQCGSQPMSYELNPDFQAWADCIVATYPAYAALEPLDFDPAVNRISGTSTTALSSIILDYASGTTRECGPPPPISRTLIGGSGFRLTNGSAFSGSDASCSVTIEG
jgi:hypothetical protein